MVKFNAKVRSRQSRAEQPSEPHFLWTSADNGGKASPLQLVPFHMSTLIRHLLHITCCEPLVHTITKEKAWQGQGYYFHQTVWHSMTSLGHSQNCNHNIRRIYRSCGVESNDEQVLKKLFYDIF